MHRLHLKLYLSIIAVLVLFTVTAAAMWHSATARERFFLHGAHIVLILGAIAAALALLAYPLVRGITARLGRLNEGVRRFGSGELTARVAVEGSDEVANLAASFNESAARIEQLVKTNQMLLAKCSHELRTPLARLRLAVDRVQAGDAKANLELSRNITELDTLIGELLLSSRLEATARPDHVEPVDLLALAAEEAAHFDREVEGRPVSVMGDAMLLRRLMRNLLDNARTHGGGATAICIEPHTSGARITVEDAGPGVPAEDRVRIFEAFQRGRAATQATGAGLGLSIVRQIARVHGGDATCEPRDGGGSRFVVLLPARR
jgi:signal transduction histidine kinase